MSVTSGGVYRAEECIERTREERQSERNSEASGAVCERRSVSSERERNDEASPRSLSGGPQIARRSSRIRSIHLLARRSSRVRSIHLLARCRTLNFLLFSLPYFLNCNKFRAVIKPTYSSARSPFRSRSSARSPFLSLRSIHLLARRSSRFARFTCELADSDFDTGGALD